MRTWVYMATCGGGIRKIGSSLDPHKRIAALAKYYSMLPPFTLERVWHRRFGDAQVVECCAHGILRKRNTPRPRGVHGRECFIASASGVIEAVEKAIRQIDTRLRDRIKDLERE